jgi:class 3 adenylate cyclase/tetratricopeptide (TPR) repeat protein
VASCSSCGADNRPGRKFCSRCGAPLARTCTACGASNDPGDAFCGECGSALADEAIAPVAAPAAERRLVSVLFADLVGFTALSESRDAEEVRELLSRYFDACRRLIELYGGTVEKFIGDAVMAVWGAPAATEDDAERAVRAALDLVAAVSALGEELGADDLRARAGVLTGEAAVTLGAQGQGMVAGDLVNTASRIQSVAEPGNVFVGESTRRATAETIVYESAGSFALKGKEGETPLWRARRVVSGVRGSLRSQGLEAPFVGRDRELRLIKELFHVSADERRAQLVSVTGLAGIGKSRLAWEFYKYFDGITQVVYWHRGRCLAYGEGVAYWALADMVRMRCGIGEDDEPSVAKAKLGEALAEHIPEAEERRFVEPRLAQLLGAGERETSDRQELFAAWRLFFERLADANPTVLVFEDMQWADSSLLDFVEHLLEWSRGRPIYVVTLARPELAERRPGWGAGHRNFTSLYLEPLSQPAMEQLLAGLVPDLPEGLRRRILERAEGVPLYAVETVRMLLDRGVLVEEESAYRVRGDIGELDVPETLHALVAARLDGLSSEGRRLLQDAAVIGKTFTAAALAAVSGLGEGEVEPLLTALVRKEVLGRQSDPRSPEHGQYGFLQDIVRHVAYETLSKRERRARHLAAAEYLGAALAEEEGAEVVAAHLLDAYRLDPDAPDAGPLRARTYAALLPAAERAASLGASSEARRSFEQAAELAMEPSEQAGALVRAGHMLVQEGAADEARGMFERAVVLYGEAGETHAEASASAHAAYADQIVGRVVDAIERAERAYATIAGDAPDADVVLLLNRLGHGHWFAGHPAEAETWNERALDLAEALALPEELVRGWTTRSMIVAPSRPEEARALLQLALERALAHDLYGHAAMVAGNLSDLCFQRDRYSESLAHLERGLVLARRLGDRRNEWFVHAERSYVLFMLGRWDESIALFAELPEEQIGVNPMLGSVTTGPLEVLLHRGELDAARDLLVRHEHIGRSGDVQAQGSYAAGAAAVRLAEGNLAEALASGERAFALHTSLGIAAQDVKQGFLHAGEAALALGRRERVEELLATVEALLPGLRPPYLSALSARFRARLVGDDPSADALFSAAASELRALELPFHLAVCLLEHAEWLAARGRADDASPLLAEANETFGRLGAAPWLARASAVLSDPVAAG